MAPYIGYDSEAFFPRTLNSDLTITGGGVTQTGGDINLDSGTLFIDEDLNRVGIGTTDPEVKLQVWNGRANINARDKASTGTTLALSTTDASNRMELLFDHTTNSYWRIQSVEQNVAYRPLVLQNDGGNVGIGTTNPQHKLHIYGPSNDAIELLTIEATSVSSTPYTWGSTLIAPQNVGQALLHIVGQGLSQKNSGYFGFVYERASSNSNYVTIGGYASDRLLNIKMDGNVGIGTTNPTAKLHVTGPTVSGTIDRSVIIANEGASGSGSGSEIWIGWNAPSVNNGGGVTIGAAYNGTGTDILLSTPNVYTSAPTEKLRITGTGDVGIGVTNPSTLLHVKHVGINENDVNQGTVTNTALLVAGGGNTLISEGNTYQTGQVHIKGGINDFDQSSSGTHQTGLIVFSGRRATGAQTRISSETVWDYNNQTAGSKLSFWTAPVSSNGETAPNRALTIDQAQNVGIGTNNPQVLLQVGSRTAATPAGVIDVARGEALSGGTGPNIRLIHGPDGGTQRIHEIYSYVGDLRIAADSNENMEFYTGGSLSQIITSTGNVGIGTINPTNKFHIYQAADDYLLYGSNPRLFLQTPAGTNGLRIFSTTTPFEVGGSAATRKISIGGDPNYDISISGKYSGTANDSSPKLFLNTTWYNGSANLTSFQGTIHSVSTSNAADAGYLGLGSNADGNHLVIQAGTGNVGIGSTDPQYKLEVNGSFAATTKSFIIPHPTKEGYKLRHGSLEGPENGVYVRGRSNSKVIELPDYWVALVDPDSITISLTPIGQSGVPRVERIENNKVYVFTEDSRPLEYFYMVNAERVDVEPLEVEIPPTN